MPRMLRKDDMSRGLFRTSFMILFFSVGMFEIQPEETYTVVVNAANPVAEITRHDLAEIFLKKTRKWRNGAFIDPVDLSESSAVRTDFSKDIYRRRVAAIKAYWQKQIFAGRGVPPPEKIHDLEVLRYVDEHRAAIGYISAATSIEGFRVKVIEVVDNK